MTAHLARVIEKYRALESGTTVPGIHEQFPDTPNLPSKSIEFSKRNDPDKSQELKSSLLNCLSSILYQKDFSDPEVDQGSVERLRKLINGAISPSKDAATRFQSYCRFVLELIRLFEAQLSSSSQESAYFNACFFCNIVPSVGLDRSKFARAPANYALRGAHLAQAYCQSTGGARDATDPVFMRLGALGAFLNEYQNVGVYNLGQPIWRICSSLLAAQCRGNVMVMAPGGMPADSIFWFNELPVLVELQKLNRVRRIFYYTRKEFPFFINVQNYSTGQFGDDGDYQVLFDWQARPTRAQWENLCIGDKTVGTTTKPVPDAVDVSLFRPDQGVTVYGEFGNLRSSTPGVAIRGVNYS